MENSRKPGSIANIIYNEIPEEQSLRHIIRTRFANGMPEDSIAIIMGDILKTLSFIHVSLECDHKAINSRNICVKTEQTPTKIELVVNPEKNYVRGVPERREGRTPTDGIWGLGITALEMGYGFLPIQRTRNQNLASLANNVTRILKLKLDYPDEKGKEKAKNKGKEKLEVSDYQKLVELAKQIGKKKSEIAKKKGKEVKKLTIKLPSLVKLMNICYVEHLEKKLLKEKEDQGKKNAMVALTEKFKKAMKFFWKNDIDDDRKFSRDFLEVVLMCLEEQTLTTAKQILAHPFFQKHIDAQKFERSMR